MQRQKRLISQVKQCFTIGDDHTKPEAKPEGIKEVTIGQALRSKNEAVTKTERNFPGVNGQENERLETMVIEDGQIIEDDDDQCEGSNEDDYYVPRSDAYDVWHGQAEFESDRPKKIRKVGTSDKCETMWSDDSAPKKLKRKTLVV